MLPDVCFTLSWIMNQEWQAVDKFPNSIGRAGINNLCPTHLSNPANAKAFISWKNRNSHKISPAVFLTFLFLAGCKINLQCLSSFSSSSFFLGAQFSCTGHKRRRTQSPKRMTPGLWREIVVAEEFIISVESHFHKHNLRHLPRFPDFFVTFRILSPSSGHSLFINTWPARELRQQELVMHKKSKDNDCLPGECWSFPKKNKNPKNC